MPMLISMTISPLSPCAGHGAVCSEHGMSRAFRGSGQICAFVCPSPQTIPSQGAECLRASRGLSSHQGEKAPSSECVAKIIICVITCTPPYHCNSHIIPLSILTTNVTSNGSGNPRLNEFKVEDNERTRGWHDERVVRREATQQPAGAR